MLRDLARGREGMREPFTSVRPRVASQFLEKAAECGMSLQPKLRQHESMLLMPLWHTAVHSLFPALQDSFCLPIRARVPLNQIRPSPTLRCSAWPERLINVCDVFPSCYLQPLTETFPCPVSCLVCVRRAMLSLDASSPYAT